MSASANIHYSLGGSGEEVLVFLHGNGGSIENFKNIIPFFEDKYTVLAVDSRGHGQSGFGAGELSLGTMAIDLGNLLDHLDFKRVNILGFSDGANIAMLFALARPEVVDRLILVGGNYNFWGLTPMAGAMILLGYVSASLTKLVDRRATLNKELFSLMVKEPNLKRESLSGIKAKTLVVNGNRDMIRVSHAKNIASTIPNARLELVNGDHFYLFKEYEHFNEMVYRFLSEGK